MKIIQGALAALVLSLAKAATDADGALRGSGVPRLAEEGAESWGSDNKANGSWCGSDNQCESGRCAWWLRCAALLENDEGCGEDEDCASGYCTPQGGFITKKCRPESERDQAGEKDIGDKCGADNECKSRRCAFGNLWKLELPTCEDKLADGESCGENEDCESDLCEPTGGVSFTCVQPPAPPPTNGTDINGTELMIQ